MKPLPPRTSRRRPPRSTSENSPTSRSSPATSTKPRSKSPLGAAIDAFNEGRSGTFDAASAFDGEQGAFTVERARSNEKLNREKRHRPCPSSPCRGSTPPPRSTCSAPMHSFRSTETSTTSSSKANATARHQLLGTQVTFQMGGTEVASIRQLHRRPVDRLRRVAHSVDSTRRRSPPGAQDLAKSLTTVGNRTDVHTRRGRQGDHRISAAPLDGASIRRRSASSSWTP